LSPQIAVTTAAIAPRTPCYRHISMLTALKTNDRTISTASDLVVCHFEFCEVCGSVFNSNI